MGFRAFRQDRDAQTFVPSALSEFLDGPFAAAECVLAADGLVHEALEVAEVVEDQAGDLARVLSLWSSDSFATWTDDWAGIASE